MAASPKGDSHVNFKYSNSGPFTYASLIYQLLMFLIDPAYVVAPVLPSRAGREDLKKLFAGSTFTLLGHFGFIIFLLMFE